MIFKSYIASMVPTLMKRLEADGQIELLEAVRERYATMKPDQRIKVFHYDRRTEKNKRPPDTP